MTDDEREAARIEKERHKRELELLAALAFLLLRVQREAAVAAGHHYDPSPVIRRLILGLDGYPGFAPKIARYMAQAHRDGYRRAGLMAGTRDVERVEAGTLAELAAIYADHANTMAAAMAAALVAAVNEALSEARFAGTRGRDLRKPVAEAFDLAGYSPGNNIAIDRGVERAIITAHNAGIIAATLGASALLGLVTGLQHVTILDGNETDICHDRAGLKLLIDDPYWLTNTPQLHWGCRSFLRVLVGRFTPSEWRPTVPVMPGFGIAPLIAAVA